MQLYIIWNKKRCYLDERCNTREELRTLLDGDQFQFGSIPQLFSVEEVQAEATTGKTLGGIIICAIIGLLGGTIGVLVGAVLGAIFGRESDARERTRENTFNASK